MHGRLTNGLTIGACDLDLHRTLCLKVHVGVRPPREVIEVIVGILFDSLASRLPCKGALPILVIAS